MAGVNGMTGGGSLPNGKARQRDNLPGVSFGPNANAGAAAYAVEDMAQRMNSLAFQDDAIIAAGPSTPSIGGHRVPTPQAQSVVQEDVDPEAALLEHIVSRSCKLDLFKGAALTCFLALTVE